MEISELHIQNFLAIGPEVALKLSNEGLVLIQGVNEDDSSAVSNGVGKSSIADALAWGLYGKTARGETGDDIVNTTNKKNALVRIYLEDGATMYEILRTRKHATFKNTTRVSVGSRGGVFRDISKGTEKETQELINEIMGCSLEVFMAAIYAGQEEMPDLPKMTDKSLKLLIEEASGVERLEKAYDIARNKAADLLRDVNQVVTQRNFALQAIETAERYVVAAKDRFDGFELSRAGNAQAFRTKALEAGNNAKALMATLLTDAQLQALQDEHKSVSDQIAAIDYKRGTFRIKSAEVTKASNEVTRAEGVLAVATNELRKLKDNIENAEQVMGKPCVTCGKPHDASEIEEYREHQRAGIDPLSKRAMAAKVELDEKREALRVAEAAAAAAEADIPDASTLVAKSVGLGAQITKANTDRLKVEGLKQDMRKCLEQEKEAMTVANPHAAALQTAEEDLVKRKQQLAELDKTHTKLVDDYAIAQDVVKVFGPAGVRAHILDTVTPFLNERTDDYLSVLSDGNISAVWTTITTTAKGDLKEKFNIEVSNSKGGKSFGLLSGGEKRKVRLATMLALQDLVASRATKPINLWIGDEIDDALDAAGLERLMTILERKARERGTVLVISHNELRDWVDNTVTVTKRGGVSTIEGSLCRD